MRVVSCFACGLTAGLLTHYAFKGRSFFNFKGFSERGGRDTHPNLLLRFLFNFGRNLRATGP